MATRSKVPNTTIVDIAAASGVSVATVSRIINNKPDVAEETRQRVLRVMEEIGFAPQNAWRQIRSGRTRLIAVHVPQEFNPPAYRLVMSAALGVEDAGYSINIITRTLTDAELLGHLPEPPGGRHHPAGDPHRGRTPGAAPRSRVSVRDDRAPHGQCRTQLRRRGRGARDRSSRSTTSSRSAIAGSGCSRSTLSSGTRPTATPRGPCAATSVPVSSTGCPVIRQRRRSHRRGDERGGRLAARRAPRHHRVHRAPGPIGHWAVQGSRRSRGSRSPPTSRSWRCWTSRSRSWPRHR